MKYEMLDFKVTVVFKCPSMIDRKTLIENFNNNPMKAYKSISDDFNDSVVNFTEGKGLVLNVEIINNHSK